MSALPPPVRCPRCSGSGHDVGSYCQLCMGTGFVDAWTAVSDRPSVIDDNPSAERMEPTNRLRWVKRVIADQTPHRRERVLQQLWAQVTSIPPDITADTLAWPAREEWRDVPTEDET